MQDSAFDRLQAIIDWADFALNNPNEFNKHGVKNLDGPVFDAARKFLATQPAPADAVDCEALDAAYKAYMRSPLNIHDRKLRLSAELYGVDYEALRNLVDNRNS